MRIHHWCDFHSFFYAVLLCAQLLLKGQTQTLLIAVTTSFCLQFSHLTIRSSSFATGTPNMAAATLLWSPPHEFCLVCVCPIQRRPAQSRCRARPRRHFCRSRKCTFFANACAFLLTCVHSWARGTAGQHGRALQALSSSFLPPNDSAHTVDLNCRRCADEVVTNAPAVSNIRCSVSARCIPNA
jgi:hypothetical protein